MKTLEERIQSDAEAWTPEPGDWLVGTVLDVQDRESEYSGFYPLVTVETDAGDELEFHAYHEVARNEILRRDPKPGDQIGVRFKGEIKSKAGGAYNGYKVLIVKADDAGSDDAGDTEEPPKREKPPLPHEGGPRPGEESF